MKNLKLSFCMIIEKVIFNRGIMKVKELIEILNIHPDAEIRYNDMQFGIPDDTDFMWSALD